MQEEKNNTQTLYLYHSLKPKLLFFVIYQSKISGPLKLEREFYARKNKVRYTNLSFSGFLAFN